MLRGGKVIYGQVCFFCLCVAAFSTKGVLQAGVHTGVVTLGSRAGPDGIFTDFILTQIISSLRLLVSLKLRAITKAMFVSTPVLFSATK